MKIKVTKKNIDNGKNGGSTCCPIACALKKLDPSDESISVGHFGFTFQKVRYNLPLKVTQLIQEFDMTGKMTPFNFEAVLAKEGSYL